MNELSTTPKVWRQFRGMTFGYCECSCSHMAVSVSAECRECGWKVYENGQWRPMTGSEMAYLQHHKRQL